MRCEDRGPDLLARALGQTGDMTPDAASELDAHVAACAACRDETARFAAAVAATARAGAAEPGEPPRALRARILAAVRDEADDRRAEAAASAAVAAARSCPDVREDLPLLVLGHLDAADRARVEAHVAACDACADERRVAERLVAASRGAAQPESSDALRARVLAAAVADGHATRLDQAPPPPPRLHALEVRRARRRAWRVSMLVPLAAAAALLAAIAVTPPAVSLHVQGESGAHFVPSNEPASSPLAPDLWLRSDSGEVRLGRGDGIASGEHAVAVRLRIGGRPAAGPGDEPGAGEVRLRLEPATRLVRRGDEVFELESGRIAVHAGKLDARLTIRHGANWAAIVGTRFDAAVVGDRLVVSVVEGQVELGSDGAAAAERFGPGEDGLVDGPRLLRRRADGTPAWEAFLAPRATLTAVSAKIARGAPLLLDAELACGAAGAVTVPALSDSDPHLLVRLKGPDGRAVEVKVLRSMVVPGGAGSPGPSPAPIGGEPAGSAPRPTVRLEDGRPYRLRLRLDGLGLEPGRWEASLRCQSYGGPDDHTEWHGSAQSAPAPFEVTPE